MITADTTHTACTTSSTGSGTQWRPTAWRSDAHDDKALMTLLAGRSAVREADRQCPGLSSRAWG